MPTRAWFPTLIYCDKLQPRGLARLNDDLAEESARIRDYDDAGRAWSAKNYPGGYTSYASLNALHHFSSSFTDLEKKIRRHVLAYARELHFDLKGRTVQMTDCWVNIMPPTAAHGLHLHPLAFISGTYYVRTPVGCPGLKFEDPRLDRFMAAPPRRTDAPAEHRTHCTYPAEAGNVVLFESWLRHEVPANRVDAERISISFNYNWS
ncbi:TIGR02466 family protein [Nibricoccus sp. IMCC34717]|uniref:TIGR02466 family protein n=1 Tax=Nibricoccus sp. IMCC34717 TaxID=3034021 RepID=UPI00384E4766